MPQNRRGDRDSFPGQPQPRRPNGPPVLRGTPQFSSPLPNRGPGPVRRPSPFASQTHQASPILQAPAARILESLEPSYDSLSVLNRLGLALDEAFPLAPKHRASLRHDIRRLWEELTSDKESRNAEYLGTPASLSAYIRYFLPWNVFRLSAIFSNADFCLPAGAVIVDIGSGPLTMPIALYASRPELRDIPLTLYCMDRVERIVETGRVIFETLCLKTEGKLPPWQIKTIKDSFGAAVPERAHLVSAVNVFNEFFWKSRNPMGERAIDTARTLLSYTRENGSVFIMEPGDPRSGAFISALRAALVSEGASPLGPCPHSLDCPMPGIFRRLMPGGPELEDRKDPNSNSSRYAMQTVTMPKNRDKYPWCHFGMGTSKAPAWLASLSEEAGLPKERAVMSYLWAARRTRTRLNAPTGDPAPGSEKIKRSHHGGNVLVRVISDPFPLDDGGNGQYACSSIGYTLLKGNRSSRPFEPGTLLELPTSGQPRNDEKSGAVILPY